MKIAMAVMGTRGDVQPFTALASALMERGHDVTLAVPTNLTSFVERCGVPGEPIGIDSQAFLESDEGRQWLASGNVSQFMKRMTAVMHEHRHQLFRDYQRVAAGADALIAAVLTEDLVVNVAEAQGIPLVSMHLAPLRRTGDFPAALLTTVNLPTRLLRRTSHVLVEKAWWKGHRDSVTEFRQDLGLPAVTSPTPRRMVAMQAPTVHAFSPTLVTVPSDWDRSLAPVVGSIGVPPAMRERLGEMALPSDLEEWLGAGPPPVYLGLGSMPVLDAGAALDMVASAMEQLGARAIVGAGWSRLEGAEASDSVRVVAAVNHDLLLPRCAAAVHHGGAGTTHAGIAAGLPSVVCSVFADQPFWGARLERLGVGVHVPFERLDADTLTSALKRVLDPSMSDKAAQLGSRLRAEPDGVPRIIEIIESAGTT